MLSRSSYNGKIQSFQGLFTCESSYESQRWEICALYRLGFSSDFKKICTSIWLRISRSTTLSRCPTVMHLPRPQIRFPHLPTAFTLPTAFLTGVLLTLCLPTLTPYFRPYLPFLYRSWRARNDDRDAIAGAGLRTGKRGRGRGITLEDHEIQAQEAEAEADSRDRGSKATADPKTERIGEGLESCVGNTPLFRIKSLSDATGCEILAKAEFLNGGGGSPKDRVALNMIKTVHTVLLSSHAYTQRIPLFLSDLHC